MTQPSALRPLQRWFRSLRPSSVIPSLIPPLVAVGVARSLETEVLWWAAPVYLGAAVSLHIGTNVLNDYYDFLHGVDHHGRVDTDHVLLNGVVTPRFMMLSGHLYFALAVLLGLAIGAVRGPAFILAGVCAAACAYFYTGDRVSLKYFALGDVVVFLLAGPGLIGLGVWALVGEVPLSAVLSSLPIGSAAAAILHGNNMRDSTSDREAGVRTIANLLSRGSAFRLLVVLVLFPHAAVVLMIAFGVLHPAVAVALLSLPLALRVLRRASGARDEHALAFLPRGCAVLYVAFTTPYALAIVMSGVQI